jgi:PPP family 3-phenylpropionic acid transporter
MIQNQALRSLKAFLFFFHSSSIIIVSFLPVFLQEKGLSALEIGWILAIGPLAALLAEPFSGFLSDKYKSIKKVVLFCIVGMFFTSILFFQMFSFSSFMIMSFIFFFFMSPVGALGDSITQKTADQIGKSFGSIRTWGSIGFATTALISGYTISFIGIENLMYPYLFYVAGTFIICMIIRDVKVSNKPVHFVHALKLGKDPYLLLFLVVVMIISITHRTNDNFLALYLKEIGGGESLIGWAFFIGVLAEAAVFATSSLWFRRFHELSFIIFAGVVYGVRFILMSMTENPIHILILQPLHGITFGVFYVASFQFVTNIVPKELQTSGHTLLFTVLFGISGVVGSLFGGFVFEQINGAFLYKCLAMIAFVGSISVFFYKYFFQSNNKNIVLKSN